MKIKTVISTFLAAAFCAAAHAGEFQAEVAQIEGAAQLTRGGSVQNISRGMLVEAGDTIQVPEGTALSLTLDGDLTNVVHLTGPTSLSVRSLYPTQLTLNSGDMLAKLKMLPQDSVFEVETPVGVAAVRGTEFRTVYGEDGLEVFNLSSSDVYLFNRELNGQRAAKPVVVAQSQKSVVARVGTPPRAPEKFAQGDLERVTRAQQKLGENLQKASGFKPKLPPASEIHARYRESVKEFANNRTATGPDGRPSKEKYDAFLRQEKGYGGFARSSEPRGEAEAGPANRGPENRAGAPAASGSSEKRPGFNPEKRPGFNPEKRPGFNPDERPGFKGGAGIKIDKDKPGTGRQEGMARLGQHRPAGAGNAGEPGMGQRGPAAHTPAGDQQRPDERGQKRPAQPAPKQAPQ